MRRRAQLIANPLGQVHWVAWHVVHRHRHHTESDGQFSRILEQPDTI